MQKILKICDFSLRVSYFKHILLGLSGRHSDLMVSLALARDIVLCFWAKYLTLTVPFSTQVYMYRWVPAT